MPFWSRPTKETLRWISSPDIELQQGKPPPFLTKSSAAATSSTTAVERISSLPRPVNDHQTSLSRSKRQNVRFGSAWSRVWYEVKQKIGPGTAPSSAGEGTAQGSITERNSNVRGFVKEGGDAGHVDDVVVDRIWTGDVRESDGTSTEDDTHIDKDVSQTTPSKRPEWTGPDMHPTTPLQVVWFFIRWRLWVATSEFFYPRGFSSPEAEAHYQREDWFVSKPLALVAALWFILNWILGIVYVSIWTHADRIFYYALCPVFSVPLVAMVALNWPRDHRLPYQIFLGFAVWIWSFYFVIFMYLCGFYDNGTPPKRHHHFMTPERPGVKCANRDFIALFFYTYALQAIALFALKLQRLPATIGALSFLIVSTCLIVPDRSVWGRSMINYSFFHMFLIYIHYVRENAERRLHHLRAQVKMQYKATQRAQINERKMAESKYRLTSYVFHEVRVPLNAAVIAVQNMAASGTIVKDMELEFSALSGSLQTMSQVLNDVLDFNRIDSGSFESVSKPFVFHKAMRTLFKTIEVLTVAGKLNLVVDMDPEIDRAARRASYRALGQTPEAIEAYISSTPEVEGLLVGDEARLRQIIHNLASNACKFTQPGGKITINTKLIPQQADANGTATQVIDVPVNDKRDRLSASNISLHNRGLTITAPSIIVRIEVTDTGCGIARAESRKLFSPFVQTDRGRQQGRYGSGLGLALVRNIVKLLGGRLGFSSVQNEGSTFWVEIPFGVGPDVSSPGSDISSDAGSDIVAVRDAARKMLPPPEAARVEKFAMTVDAAALQASASVNSISNHGSILERVANASPEISSRQYPSRRNSDAPGDTTVPPSPSSPSARPGPPVHARRPSKVILPSRVFARDPIPTTSTFSTSMSSMSGDSPSPANPMALFDRNFTGHGASSTRDVSQPFVAAKGLNVLLVDDDFMTRSVTKKMLERYGCEVSTAENGRIAVQMILGQDWSPSTDSHGSTYFQKKPAHDSSSEHTPQETPRHDSPVPPSRASSSSPWNPRYDLVLLDNQMPIMSGQQAIKVLRSLGRKEYVVGLTGNALLPDQQEYREAGVDEVVAKPIQQDALQDVFRKADSKRRRDSLRHEPP